MSSPAPRFAASPLAGAPLVVAIDGPAGSGKSTLARRLAQELGWAHLDTGAMYRAVTVRALDEGVPTSAGERIVAIARSARIDVDPVTGRVQIDGEDVTDRIRSARVNAAVSVVAAMPEIREVMRTHQRRFASENRAIVAEGRDMGTVVFPDAVVKVFLLASVDERVRRRAAEMREKDPTVDSAAVREALVERDRLDEGRSVDPLRPAPDAVSLDTTILDPDKVLEQVLERVTELVRSRVPPPATA